jgi:hypothetical protein
MSNPFEDLRQAVVVRPMNSPGPQGAAAPHMKIRYSADGVAWHNTPVETDKYLSFSTDNGITWSDAIYFNNLSETLEWVEKARQWAENPENVEVEPGKYSALHHATKAARSETNAEAAALDAAGSAAKAFGAAAPAWDSTTTYSYNDVVSFDNGHTYRCIGSNVTTPPNTDGVDDEINWTRITVGPDGFFEYDTNYDLQPVIAPVAKTGPWMLDELGDIQPRLDPDLAVSELDELISESVNIKHVDSVAELRSSTFSGRVEYLYLDGYYGKGTPGGGLFYRDAGTSETDNGGTVFVDANNVVWKRLGVFEEYYASWFGVSTNSNFVADNSILIQNALNVMPSNSVLIFGPGIYNCRQTITMPLFEGNIKHITLRGSIDQGHHDYDFVSTDTNRPCLRYLGTSGIFIDFPNSSNIHLSSGLTIKDIIIKGPGKDTGTIGLHFNNCLGLVLDNITVSSFETCIQIDGHYYYSQFTGVRCKNATKGFVTNDVGNGSAFDRCDFRWCDIGFYYAPGTTGTDYCNGIYFNNCYFEGNITGLKANMQLRLTLTNCYFEGNTGYSIDLYHVPVPGFPKTILALHNCYVWGFADNLTSNRAFIRLDIPEQVTPIFDFNALYINLANRTIDYFIYTTNPNVVIRSENNVVLNTLQEITLPICSTIPATTSYFNSDLV